MLLAALLATLYLASRNLSGINQRFNAVMWQCSPVSVHAISQGRTFKPVFSAIFVVGV